MPSSVATHPAADAKADLISLTGLPAVLVAYEPTEYVLTDNDTTLTEAINPYVLKVRDMPDADRPREKMMRYGPAELSLAELVAILLAVGTRREEVMVMARRILKEYGERSLMSEANPQRLADVLQIPLIKACQLVACFEIGRRFYATREGRPIVVRTAQQAYEYLAGIGRLQKEQLRALYLNSRYRVIHEEIVSIGSLTANIVHPREVFQPAIEYGAAAVIIAHNHPSGSLQATSADAEVTEQLLTSGKILGIELLDHLIITRDGYKSIIGDSI